MGSDAPVGSSSAFRGRFNSRSRMGSDALRCRALSAGGVSIRAPAWGATTIRAHLEDTLQVSIRAPAWGATQMPWRSVYLEKFQFALPHGERPRKTMCKMPIRGFNSRSRMGSDAIAGRFVFRSVGFNSRSRMGSDCHHAMTGTACIESALFASQAGKVLWSKMQFVYHVFKSISIHHAISAANTPAFR